MAKFIRFAETVRPSENKRIESVTVNLKIKNTAGNFWFTDIQLQEGSMLTGYELNTSYLSTDDGAVKWHNGIIRNSETIIIFNTGTTSNGLDIYIYPKQNISSESIEISQGYGSNKAVILPSVNTGDEIALIASNKTCTINGNAAQKQGFYQYTAAIDSKHPIKMEEGKGATLYFEYREKVVV